MQRSSSRGCSALLRTICTPSALRPTRRLHTRRRSQTLGEDRDDFCTLSRLQNCIKRSDTTTSAGGTSLLPRTRNLTTMADTSATADTAASGVVTSMHGYSAKYANAPTLVKLETPVPDPDSAGSAASAGDLEKLKALVSEKGDSILLKPDASGNVPLIWACENGHTETVDFLVGDSGPCAADVKREQLFHRGFLGTTAFSRAVRRGDLAIVQVLITAAGSEAVALGNVHNEKLQYPMHFATYKQHKNVLQFLLDSGLDTTVKDRKGRTPAEDTKSEEIREMVISHRKKVPGFFVDNE
ncbi:unnamed protein product [Amoebophrya sp. A25]|nr:unnamed protein product [Amoebophrya sp. A25]|eukprot:GSA25T00000813001.1